MQVEIISTGDEVITGFITDTNAAWLSQELLSLGIQVSFRHTCGDKLDDIRDTILKSSQNADLVFVNGGLGPTTDDNTSKAAALAAEVPLIRHYEWVEKIQQWHTKRSRVMSDTNLKQADIPQGGTIIDNPNGTACGFYVKINRATCFFTPGVPHEFKAMYTDFIKPYLLSHVKEAHITNVKRFFLFGIGESNLQQHMNSLSFPREIVIGYRAAYPILELKIIAHGASEETTNTACTQVRKLIKSLLLCEDEFNLPKLIAYRIGANKVDVYDSVTSGLLPLELSKEVNVSRALVLRNNSPSEMADFLAHDDADYIVTIYGDKLEQTYMQIINKKQKLDRIFQIHLNITIKQKIKAALSLCVQMIMHRVLSGDALPKFEIAELHELSTN